MKGLEVQHVAAVLVFLVRERLSLTSCGGEPWGGGRFGEAA